MRSGFRSMHAGDAIWAYLSVRQELCAVGTVAAVGAEDQRWFVDVRWDEELTARLGADPIPRASFGQVPMSTCRADARTAAVLEAWLG